MGRAGRRIASAGRHRPPPRSFVVFDALHAAKSRAEVPPEGRREFYLWLDEVQIYDGASSGTLAALLEQVAKFGVRALL